MTSIPVPVLIDIRLSRAPRRGYPPSHPIMGMEWWQDGDMCAPPSRHLVKLYYMLFSPQAMVMRFVEREDASEMFRGRHTRTDGKLTNCVLLD